MAAQEVTLHGVVIARADSAPVRAARITTPAVGRSVTSDARGRFRIAGIRPGRDTLTIARIGFHPVRVPVTADASPLRIALDAAPVVLPTIVTVGSRRPQAAADLTVPVVTIDRGEIATSGALALDDLLHELPGLQPSAEPPARSTLMIRGIGGSRVLVMVDGEPVSGAMIEDRDVSRISLASVEQVEVVKGPLAAVYGSEAIGGVINVVTRTPEGPLALGGEASSGSHGRRSVALEASRGGAVAWRLGAANRSVDQVATRVPGGGTLQRVWDLRGSTQAALSATLRVRVDGGAFKERQRWPVDGTINAFNDNHGWNGWVELQRDAGSTALRTRFSVQQFAHRYREAAGPVPYRGTGAPTQRERSARLLVTASRDLAGGHVVDAGGELSWRRVEAADRLVGGTLDDRTADAWLQDAWHRGPMLLSAVMRVGTSSRWGTTLTPSVSAAWQRDASLRLHGSIARGFRGPSFKEGGWSFSNPAAGYLVEGNAALEPERSWQYAAGFTWQPTSTGTIAVEAYRNALDDLIALRFTGSTPGGLQRYQPVNVDAASTQGLDVAIEQRWGGTRLLLAWSWLGSRDADTDAPLPGRVPHTGRLAVSRASGPLELTAVGRLSTAVAQGTDGTPARDALAALDLALQWQPAPLLTLHAGIDNLLDARPAGWQGPIGRALRVGVSSRWQP